MFHKQAVRPWLLVVCILAMLLTINVGAVGAVSMVMSGGNATPNCEALTKFNSENFSTPLKIDNLFYPLVPGMQYTLEGTTSQGTHTVVLTVTDLSKVIDGVRTRVLWDRDFQDGELAESELAFQAQDNQGNVWVLGEYPEEFEAGTFTGAPSTWISGIGGAKGGVLVPGQPLVGGDPFLEGKSLGVGFWDCGQVYAQGQFVKVPTGKYSGVMVINEWAPLEPTGGIQQKFYAPGVGNVKIGALNDPEAETLVLSRLVNLGPHALALVRQEAINLDQHGYQVSSVYSQTSPVELWP